MVKLENISKSFADKEIIKEIDLEIYEGEFLTLLGPSGCGKTTVLRMISGLEVPSKGKVFIDNEDVTNEVPQKRDVNTIFQNFALFNTMSVQKNIEFGLKMKKLPEKEIKSRTEDIITMIQMQDFKDAMPLQLSEGQQQRVALAREEGDRLAASYVNYYTGNGFVALPIFGDANDDAAIRLLSELYPDRVIEPIYAREILLGGGNIHCITQQVPK